MYTAAPDRYDHTPYRRCGHSGLLLPAVSLGLWHNFGGTVPLETSRALVRRAFDLGITHFDLANNYGPPYGSAEESFGRLVHADLRAYRDELVISTKAGYDMWPGPYGNWGSRKHLLSSLDQSLRRTRLEYVDIFYSHRPDPETPLEETMGALASAVQAGKALYVALSNYSPEQTERAVALLRELRTPCVLHQVRYSLLQRKPETGLLELLGREDVGAIAFSPLAQGLLSERYLAGIPDDSRAAGVSRFLQPTEIDEGRRQQLLALRAVATERGQTLAQMALAWVLRDRRVSSVLIGASKVEQLEENVRAAQNTAFTPEELQQLDNLCPPPPM